MRPLFTVPVHEIDAAGVAKSFELPLAWLSQVLDDTDVSAVEAGQADVRLSKTGHDIIVRGKARATFSVPCARCLNPVTYPIAADLSLLLVPAKPEHAARAAAAKAAAAAKGDAPKGEVIKGVAVKGVASKTDVKPNGSSGNKKGKPREDEEYEFSSEEADVDHYDGETVVLDELLREALLLETPSFPLCSEDCPGIRPSAKSAPERIEPVLDPRLSPLRALKTKLMLAASKDAPAGEGAPPDGSNASSKAPAERPVPPGKTARPKIQSHRTKDSIGASGASKKAKAKPSSKKAK